MALTINTNLASLAVQANMNKATNSLNKSIERMTTGYKINSAGDDAAGYSVATKFATNLSSTSVAESNTEIGTSMLSTLSKSYDLVVGHLQRIRDLSVEAANGTYGADSLDAIVAEINARWDEVDRISAVTEFNGINIMNLSTDGSKSIDLQVGIDSSGNSVINLAGSLFKKATTSALMVAGGVTTITKTNFGSTLIKGGNEKCRKAIEKIDAALKEVTSRQTSIGAAQNRLDSAQEALATQYSNISASLSTVRDADVAKESSAYIKSQILQQASATLLATANQAPSIALNLI